MVCWKKKKRKKVILLVRNERPETFYFVAEKNVNESGQWFLRNDAATSNDRLHDLWSDLALAIHDRFFQWWSCFIRLILVWILRGIIFSDRRTRLMRYWCKEGKDSQWKRSTAGSLQQTMIVTWWKKQNSWYTIGDLRSMGGVKNDFIGWKDSKRSVTW